MTREISDRQYTLPEAEAEAVSVQAAMRELDPSSTPLTSHAGGDIQVAHDLAEKTPEVTDQWSAYDFVKYFCKHKYPQFHDSTPLLDLKRRINKAPVMWPNDIKEVMEVLSQYLVDIEMGLYNPQSGNKWRQGGTVSRSFAERNGKNYQELLANAETQVQADLGEVLAFMEEYAEKDKAKGKN